MNFRTSCGQAFWNKVKGPMADTADSMSALDSINREISSRLDLGNDVSNNLLKGLGDKFEDCP